MLVHAAVGCLGRLLSKFTGSAFVLRRGGLGARIHALAMVQAIGDGWGDLRLQLWAIRHRWREQPHGSRACARRNDPVRAIRSEFYFDSADSPGQLAVHGGIPGEVPI